MPDISSTLCSALALSHSLSSCYLLCVCVCVCVCVCLFRAHGGFLNEAWLCVCVCVYLGKLGSCAATVVSSACMRAGARGSLRVSTVRVISVLKLCLRVFP